MPHKDFGIHLKKKYGQHFLKEAWVVDQACQNVELDNNSSVFEIGGGGGFLTNRILKENLARLWVFEIDPDWANFLKKNVKDPRLQVFQTNILDIDFQRFNDYKPWTLLSNLPYQITFPILYLLQKNEQLLKEGVIMVQEEVAQKLLKTSGRDYGFVSLFFQHHFEWKMLDKIPPEAFNPPPKIFSRLLYFKPKINKQFIPNEEQFWKFVKICFRSPRRTLKNNLLQSSFDLGKISDSTLQLRAQQIDMNGLLNIWNDLI